MTAGYREGDQPRLDAQAFLTKPFDLDRLVATVADLVSQGS
jgi:DNA-binding NtrC family response regulator